VRILGGQLVRGAALPGSRRLASELGVSRTTVLEAIEALRNEGYVVASPRSAVRVAADLPDQEPSAGARRGSVQAIVPRLSEIARAASVLPRGVPRLGIVP